MTTLFEMERERTAERSMVQKEKDLGADLKFEDIIDEVAGIYPKVMIDGEPEAGAWSCGMVAGLIHDIPSCKDLIDQIMKESEDIINNRLGGFLKN
jgi:nitronate monooxygenase